MLVGWRPKEAGIPWTDSYGTEKTVLFGEKGDLAIVEALKAHPNRTVLGIIPILAPASHSSGVCGVWILYGN